MALNDQFTTPNDALSRLVRLEAGQREMLDLLKRLERKIDGHNKAQPAPARAVLWKDQVLRCSDGE